MASFLYHLCNIYLFTTFTASSTPLPIGRREDKPLGLKLFNKARDSRGLFLEASDDILRFPRLGLEWHNFENLTPLSALYILGSISKNGPRTTSAIEA